MTTENAQTEQTNGSEDNNFNFISQNRDYRQRTPHSLTESRGGQKKNATEDTQNNSASKDTKDTQNTGSEDTTDWKKRYSDLQSYLDKQKLEWSQKIQDSNNRIQELERKAEEFKDAAENKLPLTEEQLKTLADEYPEFDKLASTRGDMAAQKYVQKLNEKIEKLEATIKESHVKEARNELAKLHSDFKDFEEGGKHFNDFKSWVQDQPQGIQNLFNSTSITDIARGLDIYKQEKGLDKKAKKKEELEDTMGVMTDDVPVEPKGQQKKIWKRSEIKSLNPRMPNYEALVKDINEAAKEGRIMNG